METLEGTRKKPVVSVVIPAHNEEKWIASCLESVLGDSYPHKEVIVIDDASTDNTGEILRRFPVTVIRNEKPVGPSSARNIGVKEAKGQIIVFIDAHCIVDDTKWIEKFLRFFRDPEVGAVAGYLRRKQSQGSSLRFKVGSKRRLIKSANGAYRKTIFEEVGGFDPLMEWVGDADLTYKVYRSGWEVVHSRDITVLHAERLWPIKRAFLYGTYFFPLLKRYPREIIRERSFALSSMGIGLVLTFGLVADLLYKFPIFTVSFMVFISVLNGAACNLSISRILKDGFYTTVWSFAYYLGALYGGLRRALLLGKS